MSLSQLILSPQNAVSCYISLLQLLLAQMYLFLGCSFGLAQKNQKAKTLQSFHLIVLRQQAASSSRLANKATVLLKSTDHKIKEALEGFLEPHSIENLASLDRNPQPILSNI